MLIVVNFCNQQELDSHEDWRNERTCHPSGWQSQLATKREWKGSITVRQSWDQLKQDMEARRELLDKVYNAFYVLLIAGSVCSLPDPCVLYARELR